MGSTYHPVQHMTILLAVVFLLSACSRVELAYEHGDWLAARSIAGYLDLDRGQRQDVRGNLQEYREFHRQARVPDMLTLIDQTMVLVAEENPGAARIQARFDAAEALVMETVGDLIPRAAGILLGLSRDQLDQLEEKLAQGRREYVEEIAPKRADNNIERLEAWTGDLNAGQRDYLLACDARLPDVTDAWLEWREHNDARFLELLRSGADPSELEAFLHGWFLDVNVRGEPLRQARASSRDVWLECAERFLADMTPSQRSRARGRLQGYRQDFSSIASK